jgi:hypothetical protein
MFEPVDILSMIRQLPLNNYSNTHGLINIDTLIKILENIQVDQVIEILILLYLIYNNQIDVIHLTDGVM